MNILLTSAGRRNYLVRYFQNALGDLGKVFAADIDPTAPALTEGDGIIYLPPASSPTFIDALLNEAYNHAIRLIVPLNDLELSVLAANRHKFEAEGICVAVSDSDAISVGLDKLRTGDFLKGIGLRYPKTFTSYESTKTAIASRDTSFPIVVKPRWGSGSIAVEIAHNFDELRAAFTLAEGKFSRSSIAKLDESLRGPRIIAQELIQGQEYGLDVINDLNGNFVGTFVKKKLGMRAGETDKAELVDDPSLTKLGETIGRRLRHRGNLDVDVILGTEGPFVIEINPRFGGGYPFSHEAGANVPLALIMWALGKTPPSEALMVRKGCRFSKYELLIPLPKRNATWPSEQ